MPHPRLTAPSILFLIAVARSTAAGQNIPSPYAFVENSQAWEVFGGKADLDPGQLGLGPRDATVVGGGYAVAFAGSMNLDIGGTMFLSEREVLDVSLPVDDRSLGRTDINVLLVDVRLRLNLTGQRTWHRLQPFIVFGGGVAFTTFTDRSLELLSEMPRDQWYEFGTRFAATLGAGVSIHVTQKISLRVDGIMNLWKISTPLGWRTIAADPLGENIESEWVNPGTIRVGAAWRF
jgi:opacity protein-like surface antigen